MHKKYNYKENLLVFKSLVLIYKYSIWYVLNCSRTDSSEMYNVHD